MNKITEFLKTITIIDTETTSINIKEAEIVELGVCRYINEKWEAASILYGTARPIPPEASAIHNISNNMVQDLSLFTEEINNVYELMCINETSYMIAHNSEFDRSILNNNIARTINQKPFISFSRKEQWICTLRLAKAIFNKVSPDMKYSLAYLRYALDLNIPESSIAHRAEADTIMCAVLLEYLLNIACEKQIIDIDKDIGQQCSTLCWAPIFLEIWPFGKYRGWKIEDVPMSYFEWAINAPLDSLNDEHQNYDMDLAYSVMKILDRNI